MPVHYFSDSASCFWPSRKLPISAIQGRQRQGSASHLQVSSFLQGRSRSNRTQNQMDHRICPSVSSPTGCFHALIVAAGNHLLNLKLRQLHFKLVLCTNTLGTNVLAGQQIAHAMDVHVLREQGAHVIAFDVVDRLKWCHFHARSLC